MGAQLDRLHMAVLALQPGGFGIRGHNTTRTSLGRFHLSAGHESASTTPPLPGLEAGETGHGGECTG